MKKIAIVGTASSCVDAPFDDESWEIWALTGLCSKVPHARVDKWFELHTFDHLKRECKANDTYFDFLTKLGDKLTVIQPEKKAPNAVLLGKEELIGTFGSYFTSSIAWMIGKAILENPDTVGLWGVHCKGDTEYAEQRACIEGLIRFLQGAGKVVYVHPKSALFKAPLYCFDEFLRLKKGAEYAKKQSILAFDKAHYWKGYQDAMNHFKGGSGECEEL